MNKMGSRLERSRTGEKEPLRTAEEAKDVDPSHMKDLKGKVRPISDMSMVDGGEPRWAKLLGDRLASGLVCSSAGSENPGVAAPEVKDGGPKRSRLRSNGEESDWAWSKTNSNGPKLARLKVNIGRPGYTKLCEGVREQKLVWSAVEVGEPAQLELCGKVEGSKLTHPMTEGLKPSR